MSKKKKYGKKHKRQRKFNPNAINIHHLLWTASAYNYGWSKRLRMHPYLQCPIPRDTLHARIHANIACIPTPTEDECRKAYFVIEDRLAQGLISYDDKIADRMNLLLEVWQDCDDNWRIANLKKQRDIAMKFQGGRY